MKILWSMWVAHWAKVTRKARWLILWCTIYAICALPLSVLDFMTMLDTGVNGTLVDTYLMKIQWVWIAIMSSPLWFKPLGNWVFKRGKYAEAAKETK